MVHLHLSFQSLNQIYGHEIESRTHPLSLATKKSFENSDFTS